MTSTRLYKIAQILKKLASDVTITPEGVPTFDDAKKFHDAFLKFCSKYQIKKAGKYWYTDSETDYVSEDTSQVTLRKSVMADMLELMKLGRKLGVEVREDFGFKSWGTVLRFEHSMGEIGYGTFDDTSNDYRDFGKFVWIDGDLFKSDWAEKFIENFKESPVNISSKIVDAMKLFTDKTRGWSSRGKSYEPMSAKESAFLKFKAVELLDLLKQEGVDVKDVKITKSKSNPNFYSTVKFKAYFNPKVYFEINMGWEKKGFKDFVQKVEASFTYPRYYDESQKSA